MNSLNGKVAIVTGASKGIGAAIARGLAAAGTSVAVNFASDQEGAHRTTNAISNLGGRAIAVRGNVADAADVARLFTEATEAFGAPSILVNNAGLFKFEALADITEAEFHRQFDTNVLGILLTAQQALKHFPRSGGSIINISSIASIGAVPNSSIYSATKAAVDQITRSLARELGPRNIRVNTVAPGHTDTEGLRSAGIEGGELEKMLVAGTPLGRVGKPDDIVPSVVFLASDEAAWITGERIAPAGGLRM
ncbi:MAG TPA: glucose 1-dehydrogenase [Xanthobacteraceae bacterium]|nr:glucose 1-dehydrogenase [Xanthobacteraceae bacterium]